MLGNITITVTSCVTTVLQYSADYFMQMVLCFVFYPAVLCFSSSSVYVANKVMTLTPFSMQNKE